MPGVLTGVLAAVAMNATPARSQVLRHEPKAAAGTAVAIWQEEMPSGPDAAQTPRAVYARNDTTVPVAITALHLSKCVNLRVGCGFVPLEGTILPPHGLRPVLEVLPLDPRKHHSFSVVGD